jgi:O-antigen ligase
VDDITNVEPRINIWSIAIANYEDYVWHGVGAGGDTEYLKRLYDSQNWNKYYVKHYNAHNQYLAVFINLGIFAVILFIFIWLFYPLWYQGKLRQTAALISLTFGLNMLTENMFDRVDGIIIASFTMLSIVLISRVQHEE